jgi:DNA (cytosine-5)-methyltransferase 1
MTESLKQSINVIDLFAGCGGLSEGLLQVGHSEEFLPIGLQPQIPSESQIDLPPFDILAHVEWELPMVRTLRANLAERWHHTKEDSQRRVVHFDIQKTKALLTGCSEEEADLREKFSFNHQDFLDGGLDQLVGEKSVDLIVGGPPCQAYSLAGRAQDKHGMKNDYRNYLFESFANVVHHYKPKLFVFENVEGLLSARPGGNQVTELIYKHFQSIGYSILSPRRLPTALLDLSRFGVPQRRKRIVIIGVNKASFNDSENMLEALYKVLFQRQLPLSMDDLPLFQSINDKSDKHTHIKSFYTFKDAVGHLDKADENNKDHLHRPRFHSERDKGFFKEWLSKDYDSKTTQEKLDFYNRKMKKNSNHIKYRSLAWDKPSPTIVAHLYKDGLMFLHPDVKQLRSLTPREAALLQSFPEDYIFPESKGATYKMIGNAVPPLFARRLGEVIYEFLIDEAI